VQFENAGVYRLPISPFDLSVFADIRGYGDVRPEAEAPGSCVSPAVDGVAPLLDWIGEISG